MASLNWLWIGIGIVVIGGLLWWVFHEWNKYRSNKKEE